MDVADCHPQARFAQCYVHLCRDAHDLSEAVTACMIHCPPARVARLVLLASLSRCSRPLRGRIMDVADCHPQARFAQCYVHLCRDAHDLSEAVTACMIHCPPARVARLGLRGISSEILPTSLWSSQGVAWTLFPGSRRSAGVICIYSEMFPTSRV